MGRLVFVLIILGCGVVSAAEKPVPVTGVGFSADGAALEVLTPAARWRFSLTAGYMLAHGPLGDGAKPAALPEAGLRSPDGAWFVQAAAPIGFTDPTWSHLRLRKSGEGKGAGILALGPEGAWILIMKQRWGYNLGDPLFIGNAAALAPRCAAWSFPYRSFAQAMSVRRVQDWMDFPGAAGLEVPAALAPADDDAACAAHLEGVPKRWDLEKELAAIVARAGGALEVADGRITYWSTKGRGDGHFTMELGEIHTLEPFPPMATLTLDCGRWDEDRQAWRSDVCRSSRDAYHTIKVERDDFARFVQLMKWLLIRRGEYGRPLRLM